MDSDEEKVTESNDTAFQIANWLVQSDDTKEALNKIKNTHIANPIPAYDINKHLICPLDYQAILEGATVRAQFHLMHWFINGKHFFTAGMDKIQVVQEPPANFQHAGSISAMPVKKRTLAIINLDSDDSNDEGKERNLTDSNSNDKDQKIKVKTDPPTKKKMKVPKLSIHQSM